MTKVDDLKILVQRVGSSYGVKPDNFPLAFELFCINLLARHPDFAQLLEGGDWRDVNLSEFHCGGGTIKGDERRLDAVLYDGSNESIRVIQSKWTAKTNAEHLLQDAESFFASLENLSDEQYVQALGADRVQKVLREAAIDPASQTIEMAFMTNAPLGESKRVDAVEQKFRDLYQNRGWEVEIKIYGQADILDTNRRFDSVEKSPTVSEANIYFAADRSFKFTAGEHSSLVFAVKGNVVAQLLKQHSNQLFNANIRYGLTASKINQGMKATLEGASPEDFFFFNNGVTAVCSEYTEIPGGVTALDFQIVNGAQTVSTLGPVLSKSQNDDVYVLLRLIRTGDKYGHKTAFADLVTRYQNTQNPVRVSDFFSNDAFQLWLEVNLCQALSGKGVVPEFHYVRKRGVTPKKGVGRPLTMEDLALLRHALLNGPALSYGAPKSIWDPAARPSQYWLAFGRDGDQCDAWSSEELARVGWAYTLDQRIKADYRQLSPDAKERRFLNVLSRYVVALIYGQVVKKIELGEFADFEEIIRNEKRFEEATDRPYKEARKLLANAYRQRETTSHYARQYIGKSEELFAELTDRLTEVLHVEGYL